MGMYKTSIRIEADAAKVYDALSSPAGYRGWWCTNSAIADWEGGRSVLHFKKDGQPVSMTFRVDELSPRSAVRWTCVENDAPPWVGTTLSWTLAEAGDSVDVAFEHDGWPEAPPEMVSATWEHFAKSLKAFVETGDGQPW